MRPCLFLTFLPVVLSLGGCTFSGSAGEEGEESALHQGISTEPFLTLYDDTGRSVVFDEPPRRILSLVPFASEIILELGAGDLLVGRTNFDSIPELSGLPSVGGGLSPNLEAVITLEPDLVIRFAGSSDPTTPARLDDLEILHLAVRPDSIQDIRRIIADMGRMVGREGAATALLEEMEQTLIDIQSALEGLPPVRVAYLLGGNPPWVAGPHGFLGELIELAGGINVFSDLDGLYGPVNTEVFLVREMDIILAPEGGEVDLPELDVPLIRVPPSLEIPGPGLAESVLLLARILHPDAFR